LHTTFAKERLKAEGSRTLIKLPAGKIVFGVNTTVKSVSSPAFVGKALITWKMTVPSVNYVVKEKVSKLFLLLINFPVEVLVSIFQVLAVAIPVGL